MNGMPRARQGTKSGITSAPELARECHKIRRRKLLGALPCPVIRNLALHLLRQSLKTVAQRLASLVEGRANDRSHEGVGQVRMRIFDVERQANDGARYIRPRYEHVR